MKAAKRFLMTVLCAVILIKFMPLIARFLGVIFVGTRGLVLLFLLGILAVAGTFWTRRLRSPARISRS